MAGVQDLIERGERVLADRFLAEMAEATARSKKAKNAFDALHALAVAAAPAEVREMMRPLGVLSYTYTFDFSYRMYYWAEKIAVDEMTPPLVLRFAGNLPSYRSLSQEELLAELDPAAIELRPLDMHGRGFLAIARPIKDDDDAQGWTWGYGDSVAEEIDEPLDVALAMAVEYGQDNMPSFLNSLKNAADEPAPAQVNPTNPYERWALWFEATQGEGFLQDILAQFGIVLCDVAQSLAVLTGRRGRHE